jgi:transposase
MGREIRADYEQTLMFPPCVEDWVGPEHPARFIRDFVDLLGPLESVGFHVPDSKVGRPPYAADLLLKVWLYGYFFRIRSSRNVEKACREHMGLIWLTGMNAPDHNSLWRFLNANRKAISKLFKKSVKVSLDCGMVDLALHAVDGTKIEAASSRDKMRSAVSFEAMLEKLDRSVADFMAEVEQLEQEQLFEFKLPESMCNALKRKDKIQKALTASLESGKRVHHCEPEARIMKGRHGTKLSYNAQAVADQNGIIVAAEVVNEESDNGMLVPMLDLVKENLGTTAEENLADGGYFSSSQIGLAEERQYSVLVNAPSSETTPKESRKHDVYPTSRFIYDRERDCCICPHGEELTYLRSKVRGKNKNEFRVYRCGLRQCPHRSMCTTNKRGREVEISVYHEAVERLRCKRNDPANKRLLSKRKTIIEPVFAWIKSHLGFTRWTVTGLEKVRAQWALICTTINLKQLFKKWLSGGLDLAAA